MPVNPLTNTAAQQDPNSMKKNQTKGTGFTNINQILDANKGAGQKMGQQIGSQLTQQADSVRAGIQASQNQFSQQKQQAGQKATNAVQAGQNLVKQAGETDDAYAARVGQANQDFSTIGNNLRTAEYTGPMGLQNAGQLQAKGAILGQQGQLAANGTGQQQLLSNLVAKPGQYTRGQSSLDSLLLGSGGQQAIQQGRNATRGLEQKAVGSADQAVTQANALKAGIATNRDKTLTDLQNAITGDGGFKEQAAKQAQLFQTDAGDLQKILTGGFDASTPEGQARAQDLINRMGDFGLNDYSLYNENPDQVKNAIEQLGSTLNTQFGAEKYTDNQKQAGQNLAALLGDKGLKDEIANSNFDTNVFTGKNADIFKGLDAERAKDTANRDMLTSAANDFKNYEDFSNLTRSLGDDMWGSYDMWSGNPVQRTPEQEAALQVKLNQINQMQQEGKGTTQQDLLGKYSWGAWNDVDPDSDPRLGINNSWANLGLDPTGSGGGMRSSASLYGAANKQLSADAQLKNFVLQNILGMKQGQAIEAPGINDGGSRTLTQK
jgi:hypothetical protein